MPRLGFALFALMGVATQAYAVCEPAAEVMPLPSATAAEASTGVWLGVHPGLAGWREVLTRSDKMPPLEHDLRAACRQSLIAEVAEPAALASSYVKQTEFDNTPRRFNMVQNGRRMNADDFDAWLRANGYSVGRRVDLENTPD